MFTTLRMGVYAAVAVSALAGWWAVKHSYIKQGRAEVQAKWDADIAQRTAMQLEIEQGFRLKEADLNGLVNRLRERHEKERHLRLAADRATADSLRQLTEAIARAGEAGADSGSSVRIDDAGKSIIAECSAALVEVDRDTQRLREKVTGLQEYAQACYKN